MDKKLIFLRISASDFYRFSGQDPRSLSTIYLWSKAYGKKASSASKFILSPIILTKDFVFSSIFACFSLIVLLSLSIIGIEFIRYEALTYDRNQYIKSFFDYLKYSGWEEFYLRLLPSAAICLILAGMILGFRYQVKKFRLMARKENKFMSLINLMNQIEKYNELVNDASTKAWISEIREDCDRIRIMELEQLFSVMKDQLLKALKIERVVREKSLSRNFDIKYMEEDPIFLRSVSDVFAEVYEFHDELLLKLLIEIESNVRKEIQEIMSS